MAWQDYAILKPSTPQFNKKGEPVQWRVQINDAGQWRCYCPAFIFSKSSPKDCKHIRLCRGVGGGQSPMLTATPVVSKPEQWDAAVLILAEMLKAADLRDMATSRQRSMTTVLASKLAAFVPTRTTVKVTASVEQVGVRMIVFDDD